MLVDISSFNGIGTHFQVLRYFIYGEKRPFNVWDGAHCIFDVPSGIGVEHFVFWMFYLASWTVNLIFGETFHFWGLVFCDLDDIFGILDVDYAIWDDYLVFELIYFVF